MPANPGVAAITTLPVGDFPQWIAVNSETGRIYASNLLGATTTILTASDTVLSTEQSGGGGWTAVSPWNNTVYVIRYGNSDEFNYIVNDHYEGTAATRSIQPVSLAMNPVTQRMYMVHGMTGDVVAMDLSTGYTPYPTLQCPDGAGGFKAQPPIPPLGDPDTWNTQADPKQHPCIDVPDTPKWVAVNPVTNLVYVINDAATNQVSVINGTNHTCTNLAIGGGLTGGKLIAVNPVTNKVYAVFSNGVAQIDAGAGNAVATFPTTGTPAAIGINTFTNKVYVPMTNGTMLVINGADGTSTTIPIPAGATSIAVNPLTNTVYVTDSSNQVTPVVGSGSDVTGSTGITTNITALPGDNSASSGTITLNASSSFAAAPLNTIRRVYYRIDNGPWLAASGSGPWTASWSGLSLGAHTLQAFATNGLEAANLNTDLASVPVVGNIASYAFNVNSSASAAVSLNTTSIDFGGQSMGTTSPGQIVTVTNSGNAALSVASVSITGAQASQFAQSNDCTNVNPGATCSITVTFSPAIDSGTALNGAVAAAGTLVISSNATGSPHNVALAGSGEKSLVSHFYRSILRRAPDAPGKQFWSGEAQRVKDLGANVNEAWYAMAAGFFASPEYAGFGRDDAGFMTDLYTTFFNRQPDAPGLAFWTGQIQQGMPREVVLVSFMFSTEFAGFTQSIFGNTAARAEVDVVGDFYRGLLARLPDSGGFSFWVGQFRAAQCQGSAQVSAQAESISSSFATGGEYAGRARSNAQYVGDLYNAFLRRGGDLNGVQFWINQLNANTLTREQVRQQFLASGEFGARVQAVVNQGCIQ